MANAWSWGKGGWSGLNLPSSQQNFLNQLSNRAGSFGGASPSSAYGNAAQKVSQQLQNAGGLFGQSPLGSTQQTSGNNVAASMLAAIQSGASALPSQGIAAAMTGGVASRFPVTPATTSPAASAGREGAVDYGGFGPGDRERLAILQAHGNKGWVGDDMTWHDSGTFSAL
jgi:hypothetical protein